MLGKSDNKNPETATSTEIVAVPEVPEVITPEQIMSQIQELKGTLKVFQDKAKGVRDNPNLDRTKVMKYMFDPENQKMERGNYLNMRGEIAGKEMNKLLVLLRTLEKECSLDLAGLFADEQLSLSVSWRRGGRAEATEFVKNMLVINAGRNPLEPSGEGNLGTTGRKKLW